MSKNSLLYSMIAGVGANGRASQAQRDVLVALVREPLPISVERLRELGEAIAATNPDGDDGAQRLNDEGGVFTVDAGEDSPSALQRLALQRLCVVAVPAKGDEGKILLSELKAGQLSDRDQRILRHLMPAAVLRDLDPVNHARVLDHLWSNSVVNAAVGAANQAVYALPDFNQVKQTRKKTDLKREYETQNQLDVDHERRMRTVDEYLKAADPTKGQDANPVFAKLKQLTNGRAHLKSEFEKAAQDFQKARLEWSKKSFPRSDIPSEKVTKLKNTLSALSSAMAEENLIKERLSSANAKIKALHAEIDTMQAMVKDAEDVRVKAEQKLGVVPLPVDANPKSPERVQAEQESAAAETAYIKALEKAIATQKALRSKTKHTLEEAEKAKDDAIAIAQGTYQKQRANVFLETNRNGCNRYIVRGGVAPVGEEVASGAGMSINRKEDASLSALSGIALSGVKGEYLGKDDVAREEILSLAGKPVASYDLDQRGNVNARPAEEVDPTSGATKAAMLSHEQLDKLATDMVLDALCSPPYSSKTSGKLYIEGSFGSQSKELANRIYAAFLYLDVPKSDIVSHVPGCPGEMPKGWIGFDDKEGYIKEHLQKATGQFGDKRALEALKARYQKMKQLAEASHNATASTDKDYLAEGDTKHSIPGPGK